jgi:WD40 repeat protein
MINRSRKNNKLKGGKPLFVGKFCSEISTLPGHTLEVTSVAFHPSKNLLATGSKDRTAKLWSFHPDGSNPVCTDTANVNGHTGEVTSVAFNPRGNLLATGSRDCTAKLWRFNPGGSNLVCTATANVNGYTSYVESVAFDPSGNLLATGSHYIIIPCQPSHFTPAKLWRFNPDGSNLVSTGYANGHIWTVSSVAFHPKGNLLATGSWDNTAKLWSFNDNGSNLVCTDTTNVDGRTHIVTSVAFHPSLNLLATGLFNNTAKLWSFNDDGSNLKFISTLTGDTDSVTSVSFHPHGNFLATGSRDNTAKIWSFNPDGSNPRCIETLTGHTGVVSSVAFNRTGNLLATSSYDKTAKLWDCSKLNIQYRRRLDLTHGSLATSLIDELTTLPGPQNLNLKYKMRSVLHQSIRNVLGINTPASRANPDRMKGQKFSEFPFRERLQGPDTSTGLPPSPVVDTPLQPVVQAPRVTSFCAVDDTSCKGLYDSIPWSRLNSIPGDCDEASDLLEKLIKLESLLPSSSIDEREKKSALTTLWIKKLSKKIDQCKR